MKSQYRVAVIGGGVVGCSVLYHLAKLGCTDVVLLERKELTAGSSWHAAGGFHALNSDPAVARLQAYTIKLYAEIEKLSGQDIGMHMTGGLNVAATKERWEFLKADHARHRVLGIETALVTPREIAELCPIMDVSELYGAIYDKHEGHVDPSGATHAYAKAARLLGAEIYRHTRVMDLQPTGKGHWNIITDKGNIEAEHVVNAAGLWAREVGMMVGIKLPLIPMEHHYLLTDDIPEIEKLTRELPLVLDLDAEIYLRQERRGVLLGVYEKDATPWAVSGTPWDYGEDELLPPRIDRLTDALIKGFQRFPSVANAGIRRQINGPFTFTPDGNPLVGPVRGVPNYWTACGVMAGFAQGGGVGLTLAQWIVDGEPDGDIFAMDVARFGDYVSPTYVIDKAREFYAKRFQIAYPNEYWPAGRPVKTGALYDKLAQRGAVYGVSYAMEVPLYFSHTEKDKKEQPSLGRSNAFEHVGRECRVVQQGAGLFDCSSFGKYQFSGPEAANALDRLIAGRLPKAGEMGPAVLLSHHGRLMGEMTAICLADDHYLLVGSGHLQDWHMRWFEQNLPQRGVKVENLSDHLQGIAITGPRSRELLQELVDGDVDAKAMPYATVRQMDVGYSTAIICHSSLNGEQGYEVYLPSSHIGSVYNLLHTKGAAYGLQDFGIYALLSMRLEKGWGRWSREFSCDFTPAMSGLERYVDSQKSEFIGRDAFIRDQDQSPKYKIAHFEVDTKTADATGYEPIWYQDHHIGFVTSGGYGHRTGKSLAMGYIPPSFHDDDKEFEIDVLGNRYKAKLLKTAPYDPFDTLFRA